MNPKSSRNDRQNRTQEPTRTRRPRPTVKAYDLDIYTDPQARDILEKAPARFAAKLLKDLEA